MRTGSLASALGLTTGACAALVGSVALATDAAMVGIMLKRADTSDVLRGTSIMSQATSGLFEGSFDFSFRPEFVGQIQRDEATRGLSRPSSGGDGMPSILYTNLTTLNTINTFSIGGVKRVGAGNLALRGGYQSAKSEQIRYDGFDRTLKDTHIRQIEALYGFKLGSGYLGCALEHTRGDLTGLSERASDNLDRSITRKTAEFGLGIGYAQPAGDKRGWSVGAWLSRTDVLYDDPFGIREDNFRTTYDVSGLTLDLRGRYNMSFGNADGEISAGVRRGTFDLDNPLTSSSYFQGATYTERVSNDDTKRTTYDIGWRFLDRLGEKVDFAYGVQYAYSKFESELQVRGAASDGTVTDFRTAFSSNYSDLIIPVAVRFQLNPMFRMFAGAGFTYYWDETSHEFDYLRLGKIREDRENNHTATNYAAGLRMDFNEHLSGELGLLHPADAQTDRDRDTVQGDRLSFQFALSF